MPGSEVHDNAESRQDKKKKRTRAFSCGGGNAAGPQREVEPWGLSIEEIRGSRLDSCNDGHRVRAWCMEYAMVGMAAVLSLCTPRPC